jgi:2-oxo-4-hydroxy-4-carboxy-5-ureidoimidazoline decarboxylase|tara:strand:- start:1127 stop:1633 length:507 start_codon:yes stop_codon:yes gene_type:complete
MNAIDKVNKLSRTEFVEVFANIFEKTEWIAEKLYDQKPFNSFEDLCSEMLEIFKTSSKETQLKVLKAHPDLADKVTINSLTTNSRTEQSNAGLGQCSKEESNEFKNLNNDYKKKFSFPFILAVKGKNKVEILSEFKKRILNSVDDEFTEAIIQVCKVANLRLNEINIK